MTSKEIVDDLRFQNLIGGKELLLSTKTFQVTSPFYPDFITVVPDSNVFDITTAISKAKTAIGICSQLSFEERENILKKASNNLKFSQREKEYVVKMTGMPLYYVEKNLDAIPLILKEIPQIIRERIGVRHGRIARHPMNERDIFKFLEPISGFVYSVTPGNDVRVVADVAAWLVTIGLSGVFKVSKNDLLISQKVIRAIIDAGYPAGALHVVCWDTSTPDSHLLNFSLVDACKVVWPFGNNETVDRLLRYEYKTIGNERIPLDHFSDKIVLRHATGRAAAIVDADIDIKKTANIIFESAFEWPIGCNSLKAVFDSSGQHEELLSQMVDRIENISKYTGDPMDNKTRVGYVDENTLTGILKRIEELKRLTMLSLISGETRTKIQTTPYVLETHDLHSEFLSNEYSAYLLTFKKSASFEKAVAEVNETAGVHKRLAISVFSVDETKVLKTHLRAHHIKRMRHTTELDILFHEGQDYLHKLTEPQIHRVSQK